MLRYVTEVIPQEQIMLGSDQPFPLGEPDPVTFVRNALPSAQAELVLSRNFERLVARRSGQGRQGAAAS